MKLYSTISTIFFLFITLVSNCNSANIDDIFNWDLHNDLIENESIQLAAKCEALDIAIYNKSIFTYEVESIAKLISTAKINEKNIFEARMAYYVAKNYYIGRNEGIKIIAKSEAEFIFLKSSKELNCHAKFNEK